MIQYISAPAMIRSGKSTHMLCLRCAVHAVPKRGVDWIDAFKAFLRLHAGCR